jgi:hypothetical protein
MAAGTQAFPQGSSTVVGYFTNGEDAHQAIHALIADGFEASQIGAAFRTGTAPGTGEVSGATLANVGMDVSYPDGELSSSGVTTSAANETAVTPALGGGSGTGMAGAGKPGPITGSDLSHLNLPHEIESTLPHDELRSGPSQPVSGAGSYAESYSEPVEHHQESWLDKLHHLFGGHKHASATETVSGPTTKESQNFGTGEGNLLITGANYTRPYSSSAFESSFGGMGIATGNSRHLALRLAGGGAVVTVTATGRVVDAETILERYNGVVRFEGEPFEDTLPAGRHHVAVFGAVGEAYPTEEEVSIASEPALRR